MAATAARRAFRASSARPCLTKHAGVPEQRLGGIARSSLHGRVQGVQRLREHPNVGESDAAIVERIGVIGGDAEGGIERIDGLHRASHLREGVAAIVQGVGVIGPQREDAVV